MDSMVESVRKELFTLQDKKYADFSANLSPTMSRENFIGVRTPDLKNLAKTMVKTGTGSEYIKTLPHKYFEENQLHAFIISLEKDFDVAIEEVEKFLPFIDNWATCDQLRSRAFAKYPDRLLPYIDKWLASDKTYTIRFGIGALMCYFLDDKFKPEYLSKVAAVKSEEYYINMMIAWYFATALAKQYEATIPYIEQHKLSDWVHRKTIQKAVESFRVTDEHKAYLKTFR
ncbi:MAG: DNA alkylation repair protein [Saccharofermentans sp.]|nr:DNA alkylation repair protein [Saccharofermentans sp.]